MTKEAPKGKRSGKPGRVYVYSAPGYDVPWTRTVGSTSSEGHGRFKVGYTGRKDPRVRIKEQTGTLYPGGDGIVIHIDEEAVRDDGTTFDDHDVHKVLDSAGIQRQSEVVDATLDEIRAAIAAVRTNRPYDAERTAELFCDIVNRWKECGGWLPDFT